MGWKPMLRGSREQRVDYPPLAVFRYVERPLLDFVGELGADAHGAVDARVQVDERDGVLDGLAGALVGGGAVDVAALRAAAEHQHAAGLREVAVHAVELEALDLV